MKMIIGGMKNEITQMIQGIIPEGQIENLINQIAGQSEFLQQNFSELS
jgi:hypothetical protein